MAGIRTCDRESQVQRPNHYTTEPPYVMCYVIMLYRSIFTYLLIIFSPFHGRQTVMQQNSNENHYIPYYHKQTWCGNAFNHCLCVLSVMQS